MRGLTQKERRELKKELIKSGFDMDKLRIIIKWRKHEDMFLVGFNCMDNERAVGLFMPFKDAPDIVKIEKQAKRIAPQVFVEDNELKGETTEEVAVNA